MKLNHVKRRRFLTSLVDLRKLVTLIDQEVQSSTISSEEGFVEHILGQLKFGPIDQYGWFDLNEVDLALKLKVSQRGVIMGFVIMTGDNEITHQAHFKLNHFIEGSMLRDPEIEYYESVV